jgi:hypothetical protein
VLVSRLMRGEREPGEGDAGEEVAWGAGAVARE